MFEQEKISPIFLLFVGRISYVSLKYKAMPKIPVSQSKRGTASILDKNKAKAKPAKSVKVAGCSVIGESPKSKGFEEILSFMNRLASFEERSRSVNPLVR